MIIISVILAAVLLLLFLFDPQSPADIYRSFFRGPFASSYSIGSLLSKASLLMIAGTGAAVAFRGGQFNLGGEGQTYGGAAAAAVLALYLPRIPGIIGIPVILTAAVLLGAAAAAVSAFLKIKWNIHELISSFLLSGGLVHIFDYLIAGPLRDSDSFLIAAPLIPDIYHFSELSPSFPITMTLPAGLLTAGAAHVWLFRSIPGYRLRIFGANPSCARYGGISSIRQTVYALSVSGGLYGLTGALAVLGIHHQAIQGLTSGLGWDGITVALAAGISPAYTVLTSLLIAFIDSGIEASMAGSSVTYDLGLIIKGTILLLVTLQFSRRRIEA